MRGGIPITARLMAIASLVGAATSGSSLPQVQAASKRIDALRRQDFNSPGTEQRKRRKLQRSVRSHGGRHK